MAVRPIPPCFLRRIAACARGMDRVAADTASEKLSSCGGGPRQRRRSVIRSPNLVRLRLPRLGRLTRSSQRLPRTPLVVGRPGSVIAISGLPFVPFRGHWHHTSPSSDPSTIRPRLSADSTGGIACGIVDHDHDRRLGRAPS